VRRPAIFLVFFSVLTSVLGAAHYYLYTRTVLAPQLGEPWTEVGGYVCFALALLTPAGIIVSRLWRSHALVSAICFGWLGMMLMLMSALGVSELLRWLLASHVSEPLLSRAIAASVLGGCSLAGIYGVASAIGTVAVKRVAVSLRRLPPSMSGFRMVQLSDVHIGPTLGKDWLEHVVAKVNQLEPDAIVITGDLVDGSVRRLRDQVAPLRDLRAKHGVYFVTGNHEYYSGADAWIEELAVLGVRSLRNERVSIGDDDASFDLAGVDDWRAFGEGHGPDLDRAIAGRDESRELVLLAHQPKQIRQAAKRGVGLQLSGHTHGGQIFPWNLFVRLEQPYISGLARHEETQIYVSCGTGFWGPPMRVGAPAEITLLELLSDPA
jgi:predicted MPP superfamily phosphohydrolase